MSASLESNCWSGGARYLDDAPVHEGPGAAERGLAALPTADDDDPGAPFVGMVIAGTYRLDRVLGAGAMASVFAATHLRNANRVAVKILHSDLTNNVDVRTRFLREGYAANSVRHAGTVRALDDGTTESGAAFFVMELLEGETLDALWERRGRRMPPLEVAELMVQLLDVLSAAHAKGIVHRDIKPENLFLEHDGTLRVLDFGVARVLGGTLTETRAGCIIGTLPYMAPEQTLGKCHEVDARSDIWSVGATAFTLVSGRFVHDAETPEEMMVFNGSRQAQSLAEVAPDVASAFVEVVDRALRFDRTERWSSAVAMRAALVEACRSAHGPGLGARVLPSASKEGESRAEPPSNVHAEVAGADPPFVPTLVSSGAKDVRRAAQVRRAPVREVRGHRGHAWAMGGAVALILAGAVEARSASARRPDHVQPAALASAFVQAAAPADDGAGASTIALRRAPVADTPVADTAVADMPTPTAVAAPVERGSEETPEAPAGPVSRAAATARGAALASSPRADANAAPAAPDDCTPPFTILPVTGKKQWKRRCL